MPTFCPFCSPHQLSNLLFRFSSYPNPYISSPLPIPPCPYPNQDADIRSQESSLVLLSSQLVFLFCLSTLNKHGFPSSALSLSHFLYPDSTPAPRKLLPRIVLNCWYLPVILHKNTQFESFWQWTKCVCSRDGVSGAGGRGYWEEEDEHNWVTAITMDFFPVIALNFNCLLIYKDSI